MKIPFGYTNEGGKLIPNLDQLEMLSKAKELVEQGVSLRQARDWLNAKSGGSISHEGLKLRLERGVYSHGGNLLNDEQDRTEDTL